jgi:hypothetical protein
METQETKQTDSIAELQEQIKVVATLRATVVNLKTEREKRYEAWENENRGLLEAIAEETESLSGQENSLRDMTLQAYEQTGRKAPAPGVGVRILTKLDYDPKEALKWAMSHQIALSLDKKSFEGFAKATPLEFVTVKEEAQATIATDLSEYVR